MKIKKLVPAQDKVW